MKQMMKINRGWKLLSIVPLAGLLAAGMGFAGTAQAGPIIQNPAPLPTHPVGVRPGVIRPIDNPVFHPRPRGKKPDLVPMPQLIVTPGTVTVKNQGNATAGASKVVISCRKTTGAVPHGPRGCRNTPAHNRHYYDASLGGMAFPIHALRPGQFQRVSVPGWTLPWPPGGYHFTVFVDGSRVVAESNERNNKMYWTIKVPGKPKPHGRKPDLIPLVSNPFNGVITVKNVGGVRAGASKVVISCEHVGHRVGHPGPRSCALDRYYNASLGGVAISIHALRPHSSQRVTIPHWSRLPWASGGYYFTVIADGGRVVAESNEHNNKVVTSLKVHGKPRPRGKKPDLVPVNRGSDPFHVKFKVKNRGRGTSGASKLVVICRKVSHRGSGGGCASNPAMNRYYNAALGGIVIPVPSLRAGQVYMASLPVRGLRWRIGKYKFTVKADATHAVAESNESNNIKGMVRRMYYRR